MYRISKTGSNYYAVEMSENEDIENIKSLVEQGTPVIIVNSLDDIDRMDVIFSKEEIEIVD